MMAGCLAEPLADDTACDDGAACTVQDACLDGACIGLPLCDPVCEQCDGETGTCRSRCAVPLTAGTEPVVTDVLLILRAANGLSQCALCLCDVDGSGRVTASDALADLRLVVGLPAIRSCPPPAADSADDRWSDETATTSSTTSTTLLSY
jgi:hypothetical protein